MSSSGGITIGNLMLNLGVSVAGFRSELANAQRLLDGFYRTNSLRQLSIIVNVDRRQLDTLMRDMQRVQQMAVRLGVGGGGGGGGRAGGGAVVAQQATQAAVAQATAMRTALAGVQQVGASINSTFSSAMGRIAPVRQAIQGIQAAGASIGNTFTTAMSRAAPITRAMQGMQAAGNAISTSFAAAMNRMSPLVRAVQTMQRGTGGTGGGGATGGGGGPGGGGAQAVVTQARVATRALQNMQQTGGQAGNAITNAMDKMAFAIHRAHEHSSGFLDTLLGFGSKVLIFSAIHNALELIVGTLRAGINAVIGFNDMVQQANLAFTNLFKNEQLAENFMTTLRRFANETPFEFPQLVEAGRRLAAFGFKAEQLMPIIRSIGNAASATGGNMGEMVQRISVALGQMLNKGRVLAQDMMQLQEAGVNTREVMQQVATNTGKSLQQILDMQSKGQLSSTEFIKAFQQWTQLRFGDMMAKQANTFQGAMSTIKDGLNDFIATAGKPFFDWLNRVAVNVATFMKSDEWQEWARVMAGVIARIGAGWQALWTAAANVVSQVYSVVIQLAQVLASPLLGMEGVASFVQEFQALTRNASLSDWIRMFGVAVEYANRGLAALVQAFASSFEAIATIVVTYGTVILRAMSYLSPFTRHSPSLVEQVEEGFGRRIPDAIQGMLDAIGPRLAAGAEMIERFKRAAAGGLAQGQSTEHADKLKTIRYLGPDAPAAYEGAQVAIDNLETSLADLGTEIEREQARLKSFESTLKPIQDVFDRAAARVDHLKTRLGDAQDALRRFANEGKLPGESEHDDKLAANRRKQAEIELKMNELKLKRNPTARDEREYVRLQKQLDRLRLQEENLRLRGDLSFGDQRRRLEKEADTSPTISFEERLKKIRAAKEEIAAVNAAMPSAQESMDRAKLALDAQKALIENQKDMLGALKDRHSEIKDQLEAQKRAMQEMLAVAKELRQEAETAASAAKGGKEPKVPPPIVPLPEEAIKPPATKGPKMDRWQEDLNDPARRFEEMLAAQLARMQQQLDASSGQWKAWADQVQAQFGTSGGLQGALKELEGEWKRIFGIMGEKIDATNKWLSEFGAWLNKHLPTGMGEFNKAWKTELSPAFDGIDAKIKEMTGGQGSLDIFYEYFDILLPTSYFKMASKWQQHGKPTFDSIVEEIDKAKASLAKFMAPFEEGATAFLKPFADIEQGIKNIALEILNFGGGLVKTLDDWGNRILDWLTNLGKIKDALAGLPDWMRSGGKAPEAPVPPATLPGPAPAPSPDSNRGGGGGRAYATGGAIGMGQLALVGERGPELFTAHAAGSIVTTDGLRMLMADALGLTGGSSMPSAVRRSAGGAPVMVGSIIENVTIGSRQDVAQVVQQVESFLMEALSASAQQGTRFPLGLTKRSV